jgi:hypothetical protein
LEFQAVQILFDSKVAPDIRTEMTFGKISLRGYESVLFSGQSEKSVYSGIQEGGYQWIFFGV